VDARFARSRLIALALFILGLFPPGVAISQDPKPAWRPKEVLAEYKAVPGTYMFLADVEVPEWHRTLKMLVDTGCSVTCFDQIASRTTAGDKGRSPTRC
jgi:hypothetical protein